MFSCQSAWKFNRLSWQISEERPSGLFHGVETCGFCFIPRESRSMQKGRALWFRKHPTLAHSKWMWQLDVEYVWHARADTQQRHRHDKHAPYRRTRCYMWSTTKQSINSNVSSLTHRVSFSFFYPFLFSPQPRKSNRGQQQQPDQQHRCSCFVSLRCDGHVAGKSALVCAKLLMT